MPAPPPIIRARRTDPETSHAAAASITEADLRVSQSAVLHVLERFGPTTDVGLVYRYVSIMSGHSIVDVPK